MTVFDVLATMRVKLGEVFINTQEVRVLLPRQMYVALKDEVLKRPAECGDGPVPLFNANNVGITIYTPVGPVAAYPLETE